MMRQMTPNPPDPALRYHMLRISLDRYGRNLAELDEVRRRQVLDSARRSHAIESRVIASSESADVVVDTETVEQALAGIRGRYGSSEEFVADLGSNGLDEDALRQALQRELRFDATLRRISADAVSITETDVRLFYELHRERFQTPETRTVRQILITINPDFIENTPVAARERITALRAQACRHPQRFAQLARKYSECPSALEGGLLGKLTRGQLFPELDAALFRLSVGAVSEPLESELGLHLLYCEQIQPARQVPLNRARERIRQHLEAKRTQQVQKSWLDSLPSIDTLADA